MAEDKNTNIVALQEKDVQLVVSKETIGQLTTNIKEVKDRVEKALPMYDISNYSTDDIPKYKEDKALLNKAAKALSESSSKTETAIPPTSPQKEVAENDADEQQEEQPKNGKMSSDEEDAMDAFAAAMGQSVAPPTPPETRTYVCSGTKEAMECLERFMRDNGITFNVQ